MIRQALITVESPPAYQRLLGLTLLKRSLLSAHQAGIERFLLVPVGERAIDITSLLQDRTLRRKCIAIQTNAAGNPSPFSPTSEDTLLLSGKLIYTPGMLTSLLEEILPQGGINGILDSQGNFSGAATISAAALPSVMDWLQKNKQEPNRQILEAIIAKDNSRFEAVVSDQWVAADSRAGVKKARALLLKNARKREDGFVAKHFNRHISLATTRMLLKFNITPTAVTIVNLLIGLASGWFIGKSGHFNSLLGGFLFQCASIFDGCDGEIARLTYQCSEFGTKLDNTCDILTLIVFMVNLPIGIYSSYQNPLFLYLGGLMLISVTSIYIQIQRYLKKSRLTGSIVKIVKDIENKDRNEKAGFIDRLAAKIAFVFRHDFIKMAIFILAALDGRTVILWALILLSPLEFIYLTMYSRRKLASTA